MKATIKIEKEVEIAMIKIDVAVRYDEEDIPNDFPLRKGDMWSAIVEVDTGKILDWPIGRSGEMYMKVVDGGSYYLLDKEGNTVLSLEQDYVPHGIVPGKYGDYIELKINDQGIITNWKKNPSIDDFINED